MKSLYGKAHFQASWQVLVCDLGGAKDVHDDCISLNDCDSKAPGPIGRRSCVACYYRVVDLRGAVPTLIDRIRKRVDRHFRYRIQSQDQPIRTANEIIAAAGGRGLWWDD